MLGLFCAHRTNVRHPKKHPLSVEYHASPSSRGKALGLGRPTLHSTHSLGFHFIHANAIDGP
uniref:Uncharacterized protein n=1 Tax=Rhizophora mucronata TaxID=61149 RepID=A0A2P2PW39_RHIMU